MQVERLIDEPSELQQTPQERHQVNFKSPAIKQEFSPSPELAPNAEAFNEYDEALTQPERIHTMPRIKMVMKIEPRPASGQGIEPVKLPSYTKNANKR